MLKQLLTAFSAATVMSQMSQMSPITPFITPTLVTGTNLKPNEVVITIDDAPDKDGYVTRALANYLQRKGIRATFFMTGCHFRTFGKLYNSKSWICSLSNCNEDPYIITELSNMGHRIGNHTVSHVPLTELENDEIIDEVKRMQHLINEYTSQNVIFFRPPGLIYDMRVYRALRRANLSDMIGPIGQDVGGQGTIDNIAIGGDWNCYNKCYAPFVCGDLYVNQIVRNSDNGNGHGSIILMHARTEYMEGGKDERWPLDLLTYIITSLEMRGYVFVDLMNAIKPVVGPDTGRIVRQ